MFNEYEVRVRVSRAPFGAPLPNASFIYVVPKIALASVSPSSGGEAGGDQVTILGPGVDANTRVQFGDQVATFVRTVPGGIVVQSPRFTGTFQTQACVLGSQQGTMKIETSIDIKVTNFLTTCTDTSFGPLPDMGEG